MNNKHYLLFFFLIIFTFSSCELFTGPKVDVFEQIGKEVDWAAAAKLTVSVAYPLEWGNSPQAGQGKCGDTRKGYEFSVEFTPLSGFGFERWLAFKTSDYNALDKSKTATEVAGNALSGSKVKITEGVSATGARTAAVTINIVEPVTLVPWCGDRPRITQTYPPLIPSGTSYNRGQQIRIYFSTELDYEDNETIPFGENTIKITGQDNDTGDLYGSDGDITDFFETPIYDASIQTIIISTKQGNPPPGEYLIIVTVGTEILGKNGNGMSAPVSFSYRTNTLLVKKSLQRGQGLGYPYSVAGIRGDGFFLVGSGNGTGQAPQKQEQ